MTQAPATRETGAENVIWDLSVYYDGLDDPRIQEDFNHIGELVSDIAMRYRGQVAQLDANGMLAALQAMEAVGEEIGKIASYAQLNYSTYSTDPQWGAFIQNLQEKYAQWSQQMVFFDLEWNALDDDRAHQIMADPVLSDYAYHLETKRLRRPYQLSEAEEQIILMKDVTGENAWTRLFDQLFAAMTFDYDGEELNLSGVLTKMHEADRETRAKAAGVLTEGLKNQSMQTTFIFNTLLADKAAEDRKRGYPSWITSRNLSNKAPDEVVEALIQTVTGNYDLVARHYRIKRALLGYDELYDYDRYAPLNLKESETVYTWDEAREIVVSAYRAFSDRVGDIAESFFTHNRIHAPVMQGKRGGAFASPGTKSTNPWVFVNFTGTANDVMTLAHELGHGLHMVLTNATQTPMSMHTPLTTAEMASTFGEMLVFRSLMANETDDEVKLSMLAQKLEDSFATIFRQVAMNRFEDAIHTARREQGELTTEQFGELWMQTQQAMFEDSVTLTDNYGIWWSYIPHFLHTPGYVYAYAFGELLVLALYEQYKQEGDSFVPKYEALLSAGDSDYPHKLLGSVGQNLNDPQFWQKGIDALAALLEEEEALAKRLFPEKFA